MPTRFDFDTHFSLSDTRVLVTGAAGQLGSAIVGAVLDAGARVAALDQSLSDLEERARAAGWSDESVLLLEADVRQRERVAVAFEEAVEGFGGIDHLINNAGVSVFEPFMERPEESIDWVMDVNLKGTLFCTLEYLEQKARRVEESGSIVNIASHYGVISPDPRIYTDCDRKNSEIYGATKAGILQMTRYYAVHAAEYGVRVNAVSPGGIRNPAHPQGPDFQEKYGFRNPLGRMAETWEIVGPVLFLMSPAASYVTGQNLVADGGMTSW